MIKVVLDTNVFISAFFWKGAPYQIFKRVFGGAILNFTSPQILEIKKGIFISNLIYNLLNRKQNHY